MSSFLCHVSGSIHRTLIFLGIVIVALMFGLALSQIEPSPNDHRLEVLAVGTGLFLVVAIVLQNPEARCAWIFYGFVTFACFAIPFVWFWFGAMRHGWWYPPQPPIVQHLFFVDGEGSYDAQVANLFLALWFLASTALAIRYLTTYSTEGTISGTSLS